MAVENIPTVDLSHFVDGNPGQRAQFIQQLGEAYQVTGFVSVKNHGLSDELVARLYHRFQQFFELPEETKMKYYVDGIAGQRGYTAKGKENAKGRTVGDLKEFYHIGQENPPKNSTSKEFPPNVYVAEIPDLLTTSVEVFKALEDAGRSLLQAIALFLGLEESYFDNKIAGGNSILRAIHYFPIPNPDEVPAGAVRAAEHEDINLITLLMGASAEGLEILRLDGKWVPVTALPEQIVVNVGDMLQRLTNNRLRSTTHRVVNPPR
ncbi:MAG: isopenicillin N synthase family oxygenase, partial [Cytophagales bacterium]|nr:isopenicillin N synthase family oxygenase [Cytophagales bacterium]